MARLKVLIVDDMSSVRKFTTYGLEKNHPNLAIEEAANGKEAQTLIENTRYDLILCDWEMPSMKGDELLEWVRKDSATRDVPFIMITAKNEKDDVLRAMHLGVNGYIVKPFTIEALLQKMATVDRKFDRRAFERFDVCGDVTLHFRETVARGELTDVSMGGVLGIFSIKNHLPQILEKAVADIKLEKGPKAAGLEGFVIRVQAAQAFLDTENIKLAIKFLENAPDKTNDLKAVVNSISVS
ncbi:MAG: hypothetical protein A2077_01945 [Nitrospirae bacterium GWC2_46_6]|nr:MAG: hypothetical protein A2077_01945 [Nitrospirae bacterium GWC2_46_6]OGW21117.1 MAG: hypothetical protein A2Z82_00675 [Nitrospirae bacterium GWA2_46_11]OGW23838.1 MAG: hypothetical protein A2X55_12055 [Nitrospirae bacterium GWB2_47_37]HAK88501.1 hypothetical protein [Nitrospiraceae bacterium]HCL81504.1 hypothetical protein [Nitrospiraceae bacterium]